MVGTAAESIPQAARDERLRALPKAHLHLHFEHAMRAETLRDLAAREGVDLGDFWRFTCLAEFLRRGSTLSQCITTRDDLRRICHELVEDAARDGALYVEPMVLPTRWTPLIGSRDEVFQVLREAFDEAGARWGVEVGIMIGFGRHRETPESAQEIARFAAARASDGVVAFGFGGDEALVGPEPFARACAIAREAGLLIVPHAGEDAGPESVAATLDALRPDRIAHGVRAVEDERVLARLADEGVVCDVCPTSNLLLGVAPSIEAHPVGRMIEAGVPVTLGTDDPLEFGASLTHEYALVRDTFALTDAALARLAETSARASGASLATRERILGGIREWLAAAPLDA